MTLEELKQNYKDALLTDFVHAVNTRLSYEEYCELDGKTLDEKATKLYKQLHNMEKLEITKEAVLRAAEKCQTAKDILKEMFPQVFENKEVRLGYRDNALWDGDNCVATFGSDRICLNNSGYKWKIENQLNETTHDTRLFPTRK